MIISDGKLFVVKYNIHANYYALPDGKLDGDENPKEGLIRELKEELNIDVRNVEFKYVYHWTSEVHKTDKNVKFIFLVKDIIDPESIHVNKASHGFEIVDAQWIDEKTTDIVIKPKFILTDFTENKFKFEQVKFI